jgi:hypothetical protein
MRTLICSFGFLIFGISLNAQAGLGLRHLTVQNPVHGFTHQQFREKGYSVGIHYRWFDAAQPYKGNLRQTQQEQQNIHDIFNSHNISMALHYRLNAKLSFFAAIPLIYNQKSSVLEHSVVNDQMVALQRRITEGIGIGDLLIGAKYRVLSSEYFSRGILETGLSIKLPTGSSNRKDIWHNAGAQRADVLRPVDAAIQPGDGTWGVMLELSGTYEFFTYLSFYGEGLYLSTPQDLNGVHTFRPFISASYAEEGDMSAADQYMARGGLSLKPANSPLILNSGLRIDGVPVNDLIGKSEGFRRPGYAVAWENSISLVSDRFSFYLNVPYVYYQQREQSNPELRYQMRTGENRHGDASFARFAVFAGFQAYF